MFAAIPCLWKASSRCWRWDFLSGIAIRQSPTCACTKSRPSEKVVKAKNLERSSVSGRIGSGFQGMLSTTIMIRFCASTKPSLEKKFILFKIAETYKGITQVFIWPWPAYNVIRQKDMNCWVRTNEVFFFIILGVRPHVKFTKYINLRKHPSRRKLYHNLLNEFHNKE